MQDFQYTHQYEIELNSWWYKVRRHIVQDLLKTYSPASSSPLKILDIGCGTGALLKELSATGECYGIDFSPKAVEFCKQRGVTNVQVGDACQLPFGDNHFDIVLALDMLEHVEDDRNILKEISRTLKPSGTAIIFVPAFQFLWGVADDLGQHYRRYRLPDLKTKIQQEGLHIVRSSYFNTALFPLIAIIRLIIRTLHIPLKSENGSGKGIVNFVLFAIFYLESFILKYLDLPFGVSAMVVCQKR